MNQNAMTVLTRIDPHALPALEKLLDEIGGDIRCNPYVDFEGMKALHFMCWVVLKDEPRNQFAPQLAWEANFDGEMEAFLDDFLQCSGDALHKIYSCCVGYSAVSFNPAALKAFLLENTKPYGAFYVGCPGQTVESIKNAGKIRADIEDFIDDQRGRRAFDGLNAAQIRTKIEDYIASRQDDRPVVPPETMAARLERSNMNLKLVLIGLAALVLLLALSIVVAVWAAVPSWRASLPSYLYPAFLFLPVVILLLILYLILRLHELNDARELHDNPLPIDNRLFGKEDLFTQNHMTHLCNIKRGRFRQFSLRAVLWAINALARIYFINGSLGSIPTIHFARWVIIDDGRRLLFFSNYDGSWESYLGDFIDKASVGLTAVWSNTEGFPETVNLVQQGARHADEFKFWTRKHNVYTAVWYSAYKDKTVRNILQDLSIREELIHASDRPAGEWLQEF